MCLAIPIQGLGVFLNVKECPNMFMKGDSGILQESYQNKKCPKRCKKPENVDYCDMRGPDYQEFPKIELLKFELDFDDI